MFTLYKFLNLYDLSEIKESVTFNFLGTNFLSSQSGYCYENQPAVVILLGSEIN